MQSSQELFFEEFAVRFQIFFKEMASFCDEFLQQQHSSTYKGLSQKRSSFASQLSKANSGAQQGHPRRRKEPVDPDAPKKPPSSFILYFQEKKSEFQSKNPTLSITEITKLIGKAWNNLSAEKFLFQKIKYNFFQRQEQFKNKALNLKTNYQHDFEIYAKKKGITIPVKRKPPVPKPKAKQEVQIEEDDEVEIQEIEDDDDEVVQEEEVEEEEEEEVEEEEEEEEEVEEVVKAPVQLKNSLKSQQQNKKNAINQQTATNIKEKKIKLIGQASDEEQKVKKKVKK